MDQFDNGYFHLKSERLNRFAISNYEIDSKIKLHKLILYLLEEEFMHKQAGKVNIVSLGGVDEIGKNMYVVEVDDEIIIIDAGLKYPEDDMFGIDIVIPDITYLLENSHRVKGIIASHGHDDHIGAIPYFLRKINVPVYGTKLTLALIEEMCQEINLPFKPNFKEVDSTSVVKIGRVNVSFFRTTHNIPDSTGVIIHTSQGAVVYTGDFKFDQNPVDRQLMEINKLSNIGKEGVLCLLSESTNAERPGYTPSESVVGGGLMKAFYGFPGRIIVATVPSNLHRIQQIIQVSEALNRKIIVISKRMEKAIHIGMKLGYLTDENETIVSGIKNNQLNDENTVILTSGCQEDQMSSFHKIARGMHSYIKLSNNDRVIISDSPRPGNEKFLSQIVDLIFRSGAEVIYGTEDVHVSGHASVEELKLMINLVQPKYFIPIHGDYKMLHAHGRLAQECGIPEEYTFLLDKGQCVEFKDGNGKLGEKLPNGQVLIDGLGVGDVGSVVLRDRRLLSNDGILVVVVTIAKNHKEILAGPDIISRGFVYVRESEELIQEAEKIVKETVMQSINEQNVEWLQIKNNVRDVLSSYLYGKTKRRPMILPIIMEA